MVGTDERLKKVVREIPATISPMANVAKSYRQLRVAAYCRVSTQQEEQLNSYETQVNHYTELINNEPKWDFAGIYADKGLSGTSVKKRDEFNKLIRKCKQGKVDMIITKSIARFSRNTVDCLQHIRLLKNLGVDVFFEEQGIHSTQPNAEFYITIYGSTAQSESENISANVKWGKLQSAKEGKVAFHYENFLGYRRGENGQPEIDSEEAEIIRMIYERYLAGDSQSKITELLESKGILTPGGKKKWSTTTIRSILSNERYKGDAILNKTFVTDCLTKRIKVNNGERPKFYVENNHPAIIDAETFGRVQEEMARRKAKRKVKQVGTKTEMGKYCGKYALTELLVCGECRTPYRRCTWTANGEKRIVWRCINRLDYGKKYCHTSPTLDEGVLYEGIMEAILKAAQRNVEVLNTLKQHISMVLSTEESDSKETELRLEMAEITAEFNAMISKISAENAGDFDDSRAAELMNRKMKLQQELDSIADNQQKREQAKVRLDDIFTILDGLKNHPLEYDDQLVRQILECVVVQSKDTIKVIFKGGLEIDQCLN